MKHSFDPTPARPRSRAVLLVRLGLAGLLASTASALAGTHVWSGAINDQWNLAGNWSTGGAPTAAESSGSDPVILVFPSSPETRSETRNNIPGLRVDRLEIRRGGYRFRATGTFLHLRDHGRIWTSSSTAVATTTFEPDFDVYLHGEGTFEIGTRHSLLVRGRVRGPGHVIKAGSGTLEFGGTVANLYQGTTAVHAGQLRLAKPDGTVAIPGDLFIGHGTAPDEDVVRLVGSNQIHDGRKVTIAASGWLDLGHRQESIGALELTAGRVSTGTGTLTLLGNVITLPAARPARIEGRLSLGGAMRTFVVARGTGSGVDLEIPALVSSGGLFPGLRKEGPGGLELSGNNTYGGTTTIAEGRLTVTSDTGLGLADATSLLPSGTVVREGGTLSLLGTRIGDEDLSLEGAGVGGAGALVVQGAGSYAGRVHLGSTVVVRAGNLASETFAFERPVSGPGRLIKSGPAALHLGGGTANTFAGGAEVREGTLVLGKPAGVVALPGPVTVGDGTGGPDADQLVLANPGQLPANAAVHLASSGRLTIPAERNEVLGPIDGTGRLALEGRLSLNVPNGDWAFAGEIFGGGELRKSGTGTLILGGRLAHQRTVVTGGRVRLDSPINQSRIQLAGGILTGIGSTGAIEGQSGRLEPGHPVGGFVTGDLHLGPATTLRLDLHGPQAGTQHDFVATTGAVRLLGAPLDLILGSIPEPGTRFPLVVNDGSDPVVGTFAGLPEGATFQSGGVTFRITYRSGAGANDVSVKVENAPAVARVAGLHLQRRTDGSTRLSAVGEEGRHYRIDRSEDLIHWTTIGGSSATNGGRIEFEDPESPAAAAFYRFVLETSQPE